MDEIKKPFVVYAKADEQGRIYAVNSSAFLTDTEGWTEIDSGFGDQYHHAQGNYLPDALWDEYGIPNYKLENGKPVLRTQAELDADYEAMLTTAEPTTEDLLLEMAADHEYRICLMELGVNEYDL